MNTIDLKSSYEKAPKDDYEKGCEWSQLRRQCREHEMDACYKRYTERLTVTNVSLFIFIMELLLVTHFILLIFIAETDFMVTLPYVLMMITLPLILYVCFLDKASIQGFRTWNIIVSYVVAFTVTLMDTLFTYIVNGMENANHLISSYDHIIIISIYFFLPVAFYGRPYILGAIVSVVYFCYSFFRYPEESIINQTIIISYALYLFALNVMMMAFKADIEYHLRQKVLSRRQLLHQNILLKMVTLKEKDMIQTILPPEIAHSLQQEIRSRIEDQRMGMNLLTPRTLFVELHPDVSILIADMVNYTHITTRLEVADLVKTLHGLFLKYDLAAEQNNVLRIKFLGDAYVCVSGIPRYSRQHAKACVDLALDMIRETQNVKIAKDLNINMRIGVHSGEVFSGIIGRTKWQYDIWSRDVDIANRLENSGKPGMVHISQATLSLLDNEYIYEESNGLDKNDSIHINTYLIGLQERSQPNEEVPQESHSSYSNISSTSFRVNYEDEFDDFEEIRQKTNRGMIEKVEHMPVGRIQFARIFDFSKETDTGNEDYLFRPHISSFLRLFRNSEVEWNYMNEPDTLMKYSLLMVLFVAFILFFEQMLPPLSLFLLLILLVCLLAFYKMIWIQIVNLKLSSKPKYFFSRWLFKFSEYFEEQLIVRIFASFFCIFLVYIIATLNTVNCNIQKFELAVIEADMAKSGMEPMCFDPWQVTENVVMIITLMCFFAGLPLVFKTGLVIFICVSQILTIHAYLFAFQRTKTTNMGLTSEWAHEWYLLAFCMLLVIKEQHLTYINKVDYHSKLRYEAKLRQTENSTRSIRIILANILPIRVADIFLERGRSNELFFENYRKVAVMFASIENYMPDKTSLRVLNEYICYYDDLLADYMDNFKVEKIKVIGWTYMAACGLEAENMTDFSVRLPTRRQTPLNTIRRSSFKQSPQTEDFPKRQTFQPRFSHILLDKYDNSVLYLTNFALDMLRIMQDIAIQNVYLDYGGSMRGQLKIGISHGPVMAGVVGLSRPHYDIWGHPVNMASRMTSTGVLGTIQVTENTAEVLRYFDIKCDYRGKVNVKGVGETPTYLLALDESLNFQHIDEDDLDSIEVLGTERNTLTSQDSRVIFLNQPVSETDDNAKLNVPSKSQLVERASIHLLEESLRIQTIDKNELNTIKIIGEELQTVSAQASRVIFLDAQSESDEAIEDPHEKGTQTERKPDDNSDRSRKQSNI